MTLADVYAALVYDLDHRDQIEQQMKEADAFADEMRRKQGPTKFDMLKKERGLDDSFAFG